MDHVPSPESGVNLDLPDAKYDSSRATSPVELNSPPGNSISLFMF